MKPDQIGYTTDPMPAYLAQVRAARTLADFQRLAHKWGALFPDLLEIVGQLGDVDIPRTVRLIADETRAGKDRRRKSPVERDPSLSNHPYLTLLLPEVALQVALVAQRFAAPWGCAYIRMREAGQIR